MPSPAIPSYKDIDCSCITVSAPKRNTSGGKLANVVYKNGSALVFQTPKMPAPFGISTFQPFDGKPGPAKTTLDLSFRYKDTNPEVAGFYEKMKEIDDAIIKSMQTKSAEWFGKPYNDDFLRALYKSPITASKKPEFSDTLRLKVPDRKGELLVEFYSQDREMIDLKDIGKGDSIIAIISPATVYMAGNNLGQSQHSANSLPKMKQSMISLIRYSSLRPFCNM